METIQSSLPGLRPSPSGIPPSLFCRLEKAFAIAALLVYSGGPLAVILSGGFSQGDGGSAPKDYPIMQVIFILTYGVLAALLLCRWRQTLQTLSRDRFTLPFVALAALSVCWSAAPEETLPKSIALVGTTLFGIYLAGRFSRDEQLEVLGWAFAWIIGLSCVYALLLPKYGIMGGIHAGDWRGIYTHKNTLGKVMVLSVGVFLLRSLHPDSWLSRLGSLAGLASSILLILLCTSKGALINASSVIGIIIGCLALRRWRISLLVPSLLAFVTLTLATGLWVSQNLVLIADALNKDVTLTGRTDIWALIWDRIAERPWLGYGYYGFWNGLDSEGAYVWRAYGWQTPNAHNGFLEIALQLGFVGFGVFFVSLFYHFILSLIQLREGRSSSQLWPLAFMAYMILGNLPESNLLTPNDLFWVLYVTMTLQPYQLSRSLPDDSSFVAGNNGLFLGDPS